MIHQKLLDALLKQKDLLTFILRFFKNIDFYRTFAA